MINAANWHWFGQAGHFCAAHKCRYHLHTHVGLYCVSTVGEYYVRAEDEEPTPPGASPHLYETMVFKLDGDGVDASVKNHNELSVARTHTRDEAREAHLRLCKEYAAKQSTKRVGK